MANSAPSDPGTADRAGTAQPDPPFGPWRPAGPNPVRDMNDELTALVLKALESVGELCEYLIAVAAELEATYARREANGNAPGCDDPFAAELEASFRGDR